MTSTKLRSHSIKVTISKPFSPMGKYKVTVGQFKRFVKATGYKTEAERRS